jgi:SecD/SecF fusion protein
MPAMPVSYRGRVTIILIFTGLALLALLYPDGHINLHPGIDISGGVDLIYNIKPAPGTTDTATLSQRVMDALRKRIDPNGVRNLVWRPLGATQLEIQMPVSAGSTDAAAKRKAYVDAQRQLEATNVRPSEVLDAVQTLKGDERTRALHDLTGGSPQREKLFADLVVAYDAREAAKAAGDAAALDIQGEKFDNLVKQIDDTNLLPDSLEAELENPGKTPADDPVKKETERFKGFDARIKAINAVATAFPGFKAVTGALDDASALKRDIQGSGVLEFHILVGQGEISTPEAQAMIHRLDADGPGPAVQAGDRMEWLQADKPEEFATDTRNPPPGRKLWHDKLYVLAWNTPEMSLTKSTPGGWELDMATPEADTTTGFPAVGFRFNNAGATAFGDLTRANRNRSLAIVLDSKIISAPNIDEPILTGSGIIRGGGRGGFSQTELDYLVNTLNAGSLPAQLTDDPISERTVGPVLGADNLRHGLIACAFGLVVVAVFLIGYYRLAGVVATFAVCLNVVLILGALAAQQATFTLPSIAGIVLTIGTAVDANVLIFERLREEQEHRGLPLRLALRNSYDRAFSAIFDSNMTSVITSACLYFFGSEEVRGFGLTLLIGIVASLFTALFVTKTIFGIMIDHFGLKDLQSLPRKYPPLAKLLKPDIDWMGMAWVFYAFSIVSISIGVVLFGIKLYQRQMLDIEFASGTSVEVFLKQPMDIEVLRKTVGNDNPDIPSPTIVSVGAADEEKQRDYEIVTPNADARAVKAAVLNLLSDKLQLQLASKFDGMGQAANLASGHQVLPVNDKAPLPAYAVRDARDFTGGVAIVLEHLAPAMSPTNLLDRLEYQRQQDQGGGAAAGQRDMKVVGPGGADVVGDSAVIFVNDPNIPFTRDRVTWDSQVATPTWKLVNDALGKQEDFRKVTSFDASVAGNARQAALVALFVSIILIMIYIWMRFGNFKYGTATVVALLHDTLFTIAALGFAHYINPGSWIGQLLQVEPFRINLTVVAGILTIMGYSMIDTIVVFDRIRENRGKFGHLDREVINRAINETLSRTLLTAGTTTVTVGFMYFLGGSGIHGFTFVLLIGILVGTYSSVAIAAPILLYRAERESEMLVKRRRPVGQLQRV